MTRFEEVTQLQELEKKADCPPWKYQKGKPGWTNDTVEDSKKGIMWWGNIADDDAIHLAVDLRNAAPWLLEVAGCFQPGYAALLKEIVWAMDTYFQDSHYRPHKIAMGELVKAAEIMEE